MFLSEDHFLQSTHAISANRVQAAPVNGRCVQAVQFLLPGSDVHCPVLVVFQLCACDVLGVPFDVLPANELVPHRQALALLNLYNVWHHFFLLHRICEPAAILLTLRRGPIHVSMCEHSQDLGGYGTRVRRLVDGGGWLWRGHSPSLG